MPFKFLAAGMRKPLLDVNKENGISGNRQFIFDLYNW